MIDLSTCAALGSPALSGLPDVLAGERFTRAAPPVGDVCIRFGRRRCGRVPQGYDGTLAREPRPRSPGKPGGTRRALAGRAHLVDLVRSRRLRVSPRRPTRRCCRMASSYWLPSARLGRPGGVTQPSSGWIALSHGAAHITTAVEGLSTRPEPTLCARRLRVRDTRRAFAQGSRAAHCASIELTRLERRPTGFRVVSEGGLAAGTQGDSVGSTSWLVARWRTFRDA